MGEMSCGPLHPLVGRVLSRIYDLPVNDPIEIVADYPSKNPLLSDVHEKAIGQDGGVRISCHGSGSIWLTWEDMPIVIEALQTVMRDLQPNPTDQRTQGPLHSVVGRDVINDQGA